MKASESTPGPSRMRLKQPGGAPPLRKWLIRCTVAVVLYTLAGFFAVPALIKWQLQKQLPPTTHRMAAVKEVKFNPYMLSLAINGLSLKETNGEPFASWEQFYVNFQLSSLFRWAWTFRDIRLVEPRFNAVLGRDGRFNFANLTEKTNPPAKPTNQVASARIPRVIIFNLLITNGHIGMADLALKTPFRTVYEPINLSLNNFTTKPDQDSPYAFDAASDSGRRLSWQGTVTVNPAASAGVLRITGINLPRHGPYLEASTRAKLTGGTLDVTAGYNFATGTNGMDLVVSNLALSLAGLQMKDPDTDELVLGLPKYELRGGRLDWRDRRFHIESMEIEEPSALVRRRADGTINLLALLVEQPAATNNHATNVVVVPAETNAPPSWTFSLAELRLERGSVALEDLVNSEPFRTTLSPITVQVQHFSTATESNAHLRAALATELSEKIDLDATACIAPLRASGLVQISDLELKKYLPYARPFFAGRIPQGKLDVALPFSHSLTNAQADVTVSNGAVHLRNLDIESANGAEKWVQVPILGVEGIDVNLLERSASVRSVASTNVQLQVRREAGGALNLLSLLVKQPAATNKARTVPAASADGGSPAATAVPPPEWNAAIDEVALADWTIKFEDRTLTNNRAIVNLDRLGLTLRGARFPSNAPVQTEFSARVNGGGTIGTRGTIRPYSGEVQTEVNVNGLDLRGVQPWLDPHLRLTLSSASLNTTGRVILANTNVPGPRIRFTGGLALTNLVTTDQVLATEFARWKDLDIIGADIQLDPNQIEIERVRINGLRTALVIGPDKKPNFVTLIPRGTNAQATVAGTSAPATAPTPVRPSSATNASTPIKVAEVKLEDGSFHFQDQSIKPAAMFDLKQFGGTIRGLSSAAGSTAELDLAGRIDESAPFAIKGTINPLSKDLWLDIVVTNQNLQLTPFTPYMEKYAGYPLNKGRLSLDLGYAIKEGKLKAHNVIRIDQLALGQRNNSPDATKLPVKLGVALLKDANGRIKLDVPLQGNLNDPEFRIAPLVLKVVMNLIAKAAASPFKLLGGLVGGGEELSYVEFEPGLAQFRAGETNKLEKLVSALQQRPALNLEIEGGVDAVADRDALAHARVREDAHQLLREEKIAAGETNEPNAVLDVEADYERLLRVMASRQFGTNLAEALAQMQTNAPSTNSVARVPKKGPGLITYVTGLFASKAERTKLAQARKQAREDALLFEHNPELATVTSSSMEDLLASKANVPPEALRELRLERARAVQQALMQSGVIAADRLFLVEPKAPTPDAPAAKGEARAVLTVN